VIDRAASYTDESSEGGVVDDSAASLFAHLEQLVLMQLKMARRLTAFTRSNSSTLASATSETGLWMPALLNAASRRPKLEMVSPPSLHLRFVRHIAADGNGLVAGGDQLLAEARAAASFTSASTTAAPSAANACAAANPMPEAAPVTSATCSQKISSQNRIPLLSLCVSQRPSDDNTDISS